MRYGSNTRYGFPDFPELEDGLLFYAPYNGNETIENNYTGNAISVKGQMPVMSGGVIFRHGINDNYGRTKALQMANAMTNLWVNPSIETNTTGYNVLAGSTLTRTYQYSRYGSYCLKVLTAAGIGSGWQTPTGLAGMAVVPATSYVYSLYAFGTAGQVFTMAITWYNAAGISIGVITQNITLTASWARYIYTAVSPALTAFASVSFYTSVAAVRTCYVDGVQFEAGTFVTPYCDGSLGTGHAWTGAAHASTSTRVAATLNYQNPTSCINPLIGTVSAWIYVNSGLAGINQYVLHAPGATAGHIRLYIINNVLFGVWGIVAAISGGAITAGAFIHVAMSFDGTTLRLYVSGVQVASVAASGFAGAVASFNVGRDSAGVNQLNGYVDDLAVWDRCLTDAEILAIKNYGKALGWMPVDYEYTCDDPEYYSINNVATYVANQDNKANITHMYHYDTSAGVFSTNLMTAALPYNLLPDPMGVGDCLYIGCETALLDSGPFFSTIFDYLGSVTGIQIAWEYWTGAAWAAMSCIADDTAYPLVAPIFSFEPQRRGSRSVWWRTGLNAALSTLVIGAMNITGYWIRGRITAAPTTTPPPVQTRRLPFAPTWTNAKIRKEDVGGDTPSELELRFDMLSNDSAVIANIFKPTFGTRSVDRGADFQPQLNWSDEQNPTGATAVLVAGTASFRNNLLAPTGREIYWNPAAIIANYTDIAYISLSSPLAEQYWGEFRVYLRHSLLTGNNDHIYLRLQVVAGTTTGGRVLTTESYSALNVGHWNEIDFGLIRLPPGYSYYRIYLQGITLDNVVSLSIEDLILVPSDEFYYESRILNFGLRLPKSLLINENYDYKTPYITKLIVASDNSFCTHFPTRTSEPFIQSNSDQNIWVYFAYYPNRFEEIRPIARISCNHLDNYLMMRGKS